MVMHISDRIIFLKLIPTIITEPYRMYDYYKMTINRILFLKPPYGGER